MKTAQNFILGALLTVLVSSTSMSVRGWDTVPVSMAWQRSVKIVYLEFGASSFVRLSPRDVLETTMPRLRGSLPNRIEIQSGACTQAVTEIVGTFGDLVPDDITSSIDVRVVYIFTRVDGFSVMLCADTSGQFEWVNIKRDLPTLEQRKALWQALPHEVVALYPGPLKEKEAAKQAPKANNAK